MKNYLTVLTLAFLSFSSSVKGAGQDEHVVVVCIDGLAAYLVDDAKVPLPTIRQLVKEGSYAPDGMKVCNPSVTWPNHTTLISGVRPEKHGVLANGVLVRGGVGSLVSVDPKRDQSELVRAPLLIDIAHEAGLTTAEINWPCVRGSKSLDDSFPDVPDTIEHMSPRLRSELVERGLLKDETQASFATNNVLVRDYIWTEAACHVIKKRRPNLLLLHLLNVDSTHHLLGPKSAAGYTANAYADMCLARVIDAINEAGIRDKTTIIVLSDHGFILAPKAIRPHVLLQQKGLLTQVDGKIDTAKIHVVPEGGIGLVYVTNPGEADMLRPQIKQIFEGQEGVVEVLLPDDFAKHGLPHPREYSQSPDAVLVAKDGYSVSASAEGETFVAGNTEAKTSLGSHGYIATEKQMNATIILQGKLIQQGATLSNVENIDIAPTIARLLGMKEFACDGKVLEDAFQKK